MGKTKMNESKLYEEILAVVQKQPAIDTHVHLNPVEPQVGNIVSALAYGNYLIELVGAGAPKEIFGRRKEGEPPPPPEDRVRAIHAAMKLSPHSTHAWMMRQMLSACFGIEGEPSLDDLLGCIRPALPREEAVRRQRELCRDRARIEKIIAPVRDAKRMKKDNTHKMAKPASRRMFFLVKIWTSCLTLIGESAFI